MLAPFIQGLASKGRSCFSFEDVEKLKSSTPIAIKAALRRLQKKGEIAMPYRGFYVIVPPGIPFCRLSAAGTIYSRLDERTG